MIVRRASTPGPRVALAAVVCALALGGCGGAHTAPGTATPTVPVVAGSTATSSTDVSSSATRTTAPARPPAKPAPPPDRGGPSQSGLAYSTDSAQVVQSQPPPGSCHALGSGPYSRPDRHCTPGALDPRVTQSNIQRTICVLGWTSTVRPPVSVTEPEKRASMAAYGATGPLSAYEYDHFVPLQLGGAVNDPRNLWPEPGASPNPKDTVESDLRSAVCAGRMTLADAQRAIVSDWTKLAGQGGPSAPSTSTPASAPSSSGARCSASAAYSSRYHDFDVYVHSNQPSQTVTVSDDSGRTAGYHTDDSGYADVYFKAPASSVGETATVRVGPATCQTKL
jgi:hypothetical protein